MAKKGKKKINPNIKANPDLETAFRGIHLRFGNQEDIDIINAYHEIINLRTPAEDDDARRDEMEKITETNSKRAKQIQQKEKTLLWMLKQRNPF